MPEPIKVQFYVNVEADSEDKKKNVILIKRVKLFESEDWFSFPSQYQKLSCHASLMQLPIMINAKSSLQSRGHYRCVNVALSKELSAKYLDEMNNFVFESFMLPETQFLSNTESSSADPRLDQLVSCLSKVAEPKEESVKEILKHFLIEKFTSKNRNVVAWCALFEKESKRFGLKGLKQIEVLKSCFDPSMNDWFAVQQRKFPESAGWSDWKEKLISTFGDNSWSSIRYAFLYSYVGGSLINFAVKKEKMLLELDRDLSAQTILDLVIVGLPIKIQNSLNKSAVKDIEALHQKLKKYESNDKVNETKTKNFEFNRFRNFRQMPNSNNFSTSNNFNSQNNNSGNSSKVNSSENKVNLNNSRIYENKNRFKVNLTERKNNNNTEWPSRKSCSICSGKGYPNRAHSESECWFKEGNSAKASAAKVNNVEIESSSSEDESKN